MKSKLLIALLLFCLNIYGQSVPNTSTFTLQDVVAVTGGSSLTTAFANATGTFDPAYVGSKNSLYNFRNYSQGCPAVGTSAFGGVVAYIFVSGDPGFISGECHGLIAAPSDQSTGIIFHSANSGSTGANGEIIGTGSDNTDKIVALYGSESNAAKTCYDLILGGYTDWFLPSYDELRVLCNNKLQIGGFSGDWYWSSTSGVADRAVPLRFSDCFTAGGALKTISYRVRAIRYF